MTYLQFDAVFGFSTITTSGSSMTEDGKLVMLPLMIVVAGVLEPVFLMAEIATVVLVQPEVVLEWTGLVTKD